jgi:hypothetical protein
MNDYLASGRNAAFVAVRPTGGLCGFVETSLRSQAEDCQSSPVGYVEGWYVDPDVRKRGIGGSLLAVAESWAVGHGCREMASDTEFANEISRKAHLGLGYEETSRLVHFRKPLPETASPRDTHQPDARSLRLVTVPGRFAVCRLAPDEPLPAWATRATFFSISRSQEELSVVCPEDEVPADVRSERGWRCLRVAGVIDFSAIGVLASLVSPLAQVGISVFAVSTFDTDYLLVKEQDFPAACEALRNAGHAVE